MPINEMLKLNQLGLIPGPDEMEEEFLNRAQYCLNLNSDLTSQIKEGIPFTADLEASRFLQEAYPKTEKFFDMAPDWIPLFFSNYHLAPWHGGCAWIFQATEDSPPGALFQLRQAFRSQSKYLHLYNREDLIAHELAHVGRMTFQEPIFEEMLAYQTSSSSFQRWFGPIVQSSRESLMFVVVLALVFLVDFIFIVNGQYQAYASMMWLKLIPLGLIGYALLRLWRKHRVFNRCLDQLKKVLIDPTKSYGLMYRLKDQEIIDFASMNPEEIAKYAKEQNQTSLRWNVLLMAYFSP